MTETVLQRVRVQFRKADTIRYISHLDLHRAVERTLIRSRLPVDYTKGFNPRIRLNLSTALPLGCSSLVELADIWLLKDMQPEIILQWLTSAAPPGISFESVRHVDLRAPSLQTQIRAVEYRVQLDPDVEQAHAMRVVQALLASDSVPRTRRGKQYDLRPLIHELEVDPEPGANVMLRMVLNVGEGSTGRPEEVLLALAFDPEKALIERTQILLTDLQEQ